MDSLSDQLHLRIALGRLLHEIRRFIGARIVDHNNAAGKHFLAQKTFYGLSEQRDPVPGQHKNFYVIGNVHFP